MQHSVSPWGKGCSGSILSPVFITAECSDPFPRVLAECWECPTVASSEGTETKDWHWHLCPRLNPRFALASLPDCGKITVLEIRKHFKARSPFPESAARTGAWLLCEGCCTLSERSDFGWAHRACAALPPAASGGWESLAESEAAPGGFLVPVKNTPNHFQASGKESRAVFFRNLCEAACVAPARWEGTRCVLPAPPCAPFGRALGG